MASLLLHGDGEGVFAAAVQAFNAFVDAGVVLTRKRKVTYTMTILLDGSDHKQQAQVHFWFFGQLNWWCGVGHFVA